MNASDYDFVIKQDNDLPVLEIEATNLTSVIPPGATVKFNFWLQSDLTFADLHTEVASYTVNTRILRFDWVRARDTQTAGEYFGEFEVTMPDTKRLDVPNGRHLRIFIHNSPVP